MEKNNINIFKKNFFCDNEKIINDVYLTKSDILLFNNLIIFKKEKYCHPLFLNYNYCLFCHKKKKTKYFKKNLIESHINDISLFDYMKNKNIKLKKASNKKEKLIRRFVHSLDKENKINGIDNNDNNKINLEANINSDTELYVDFKINHKNNKRNANESKDNSNKDNNVNKEINKFKVDDCSSITYEENTNSKDLNLEMNLKIDKENINEKKLVTLQKFKSHHINEDKFDLNLKQESNKKALIQNIKNMLNKSSDFLISNGKEKEKAKHFSIIKSLGFPRFGKYKLSFNIKKTQRKAQDFITNKINIDHCAICLGEIHEKYTLICGDFFCRECIYERIKNILNNISEFDKIRCPLCNEPIEEQSLKRLLNDKEFEFYEKIKMKIEGLKNKNLIPCPYPDCEGFADKNIEYKNKIYVCQNNHYFCQKCMEALDPKLLFPNKKHTCKNSNEKAMTLKYFRIQKKKNLIKKCPNCDCWVQKEQNSCNNVICSNIWCNFEFCWICREPYDDYHYRNPFSMCFGLASINTVNYFTKNKRMRLLRCILIIVILIFILIPFCLFFFSFIEVFLYVFLFILEKSEFRNVRLKSKIAHKIFYRLMILFYLFLSFGLIPLGYISLVLMIIIIPAIFLFKKLKNNDDFD